MPRSRTGTYEGGYSIEPLIIDRNPRIIDRSPEEDLPPRRANSESRRSRSSTLFRLPTLFPRRGESTVVVRRTSRRLSRRIEDPGSPSTSAPRRGRQSSPPPPPVIVQERSRSTPPVVRFAEMSPTPSSTKDFVSLPSKKTREEQQGDEGGKSPKSRSPDETRPIIEDARNNQRLSRVYTHHRRVSSDPLGEQEQVLVPSSPRYEVIQSNETVRSRPRNNDVRDSKEYIKMKERADWYKREAETVTQRHAYAQVQLQNLQNKLAELELQNNKSNQREDGLRDELEKAYREVDKLLEQNADLRRERELSRHQARIAEGQLEGERRQKYERERERGHERDSDTESGSRNQTRYRRRVVTVQPAGDSTPRTPDPRTSASTSRAAVDPGTDAINRARAQHHGRV